MLRKAFIKEDGEDGYYIESYKHIDQIDPDKLEWCKFCGHCRILANLRVCVKNSVFDILLNGVKIVASNGHCDCFIMPNDNGFTQYSKIKEKMLKRYGVERERTND